METFLLNKYIIGAKISMFRKETSFKMKKHLLVLGMASMLALTGCHGLSKVDYAKFKEKVDAACEKTPEVKQVKISGKYDGEKVKVTYDIPQSAGQALDSLLDVGKYNKYESGAIAIAMTYQTPKSCYTVSGEGADGVTYYTGMGFKVKDEKNTLEWNGKGLLASAKGEDGSLTFSWVKK